MRTIWIEDLGVAEYGKTWDLQESLMHHALEIKAQHFGQAKPHSETTPIKHYLLLCQHPHVYTLGKSGTIDHLLIDEQEMQTRKIQFYKTNRGGDITYHGPGQLVAYPILDLEQFFTDLGRYMASLEEVIIRLLAEYGIIAGRIKGSTGVWLDWEDPKKARKICAMGVKSSRWMTIHGLALNMNADLQYFGYIIPCGIEDKGVTSMAKELGHSVDEEKVKNIFLEKFAEVFESDLQPGHGDIWAQSDVKHPNLS